MPGGTSIPPAPPAKKKSSLGLILGIVGGVVLLAIVAVVLVLVLGGRKSGPGLPVDAKYLPAQTKEVGTRLIEATREPNDQVKRAYLSSELGAQMCKPGFGDPASRLEAIGSGSSRSAKEFFFNKKKIDDVQQLLECGAVLSGELDSPYQGFVAFEDDSSRIRQVATTKIKATEIPAKFGFSKYSFGSIHGFCRTTEDDPNAKPGDAVQTKTVDCKETSHAAFPNLGTWYIGDRQSLETMAKTVAKPRDELSTSVAALKDAAAETDGLPIVRLAGNPKSSKDFLMAPCYWAVWQTSASMTEFLDGCFPAKQEEKSLTEIDAKIRGAAYELDSDYTKAGAIKGNIIFVARDSDSAKSLEKDLQELVSDWKAHLDTNDSKLIKETKDRAYTHNQKKFAAIVDTFFAALHKMTVKRSGRTIRLAYLENLSPDDHQELVDADKSTVEKRIATAQILEAIQAKKPVPQASLAKLVGPKWATYLTGPAPDLAPPQKVAVTKEECVAVQKGLGKTVKYADLKDPMAKDLYFQFKLASCASRPPEVIPTQRPCLATFKNAADFSKCVPPAPGTNANEPPESEFGDNAKH